MKKFSTAKCFMYRLPLVFQTSPHHNFWLEIFSAVLIDKCNSEESSKYYTISVL